jgi:hypothetical protein
MDGKEAKEPAVKDKRGIIAALITKERDSIGASKSYDTYASTGAADSLAKALDDATVGTGVIASCSDECQNAKGAKLVPALKKYGSTEYPPGFRSPWVFVGFKTADGGVKIFEKKDGTGKCVDSKKLTLKCTLTTTTTTTTTTAPTSILGWLNPFNWFR